MPLEGTASGMNEELQTGINLRAGHATCTTCTHASPFLLKATALLKIVHTQAQIVYILDGKPPIIIDLYQAMWIFLARLEAIFLSCVLKGMHLAQALCLVTLA